MKGGNEGRTARFTELTAGFNEAALHEGRK